MGFVLTITVLLLVVPAPSVGSPPPDSVASDSTVRAAPPASPPQQPPLRTRHAVYFGVGYQPGLGPRLSGTYEYAGWPSGVLSTTLGWSEQLLGNVSYAFDTWPPRELQATATLFSDFTPNRLLDGTSTDERRTGGRLRLAFQGRNPPGAFQLFTEGQYARVRLLPESEPATHRTLTAVDLGGQYRWVERPLRPDVLAGTQLRVGWAEADAPYVTLRAAGRLFRPFGPGWAGMTEGRVQWASPRTPRYEQASFGGMTGVRGYRPDAGFGRTVWTLQNELWAPVPGLSPVAAGFRGALGQYVRLAAFFDVGELAAADAMFSSRMRTGVGLGLRMLLGPLTLRADWGHRTAALLDGRWRGDLYVSVQSNVSLLLFQ